MTSVFPGALDNFSIAKLDSTAQTGDHPTTHNNLGDAINKIEAELGILPKGSYASVVARLNDLVTKPTQSASGVGFVNHGSTASTARVTGYAFVIWLGAVEPTNAANGDLWIDTTP